MNEQVINTKKVDLSIVLICYNMQREIIRTIKSFLAPYQIGVEDYNIEIIVIDTGSENLPDLSQFKAKIKFVQFKSQHPSPVEAVNHGIKIAASSLVGVLIDGARMVTPGMCRDVIKVNALHDRVFISTLAFHLGPDVQMRTVFEGYNKELEDKLLDKIDWINNGYDLYLASALALSSKNGLYGSIGESNAVFTDKKIWNELCGYEERFVSIGGGLSNLDLYKRACELNDLKHIRLSSEATFHQVHGGVATNNEQGKYDHIFKEEYETIRGHIFSASDTVPELYGDLLPQIDYFFRKNRTDGLTIGSSTIDQFLQFNKIQTHLNKVLAEMSDGLNFDNNDIKPEQSISSLIDSPIILIGRGGSGTRILSQLIQDLGLFLGNELNDSEDSVEWVEPIYGLINNRNFISSNTFNESHIKMLRNNALSILNKTIIDKNFIWGFKLPEAMLYLPELFKAFPNARIIHLTRHPVNLSLRRSHVTSRLDDKIGYYVLQEAYNQLKMDFEKVGNTPEFMNNAISWQFQLNHVLNYAEISLDSDNYCEVKYEDVCRGPQVSYKYISDFLGLKLRKEFSCNNIIDQSRINKINYEDNKNDVDSIWNICGKLAKKIGYSKINYDICLKNKKVIFVLGMHRSGTSAITRVINLMGALVPENLMDKNTDNLSGYWESINIVEINNQLLTRAGSSWFDNKEISESWQVSDEVNDIKNKAIALIKSSFNHEEHESMVIKDPRLCRLLPFWQDVMNELGIGFACVHILRQPSEVFMSFKARFDHPNFKPASIIHPEKLNLLWLRYVLDAEYLSRNAERVFINYYDLVNYPVNTILNFEVFANNISPTLSTSHTSINTFTDFISKNQQHHYSDDCKYNFELEPANMVFKTLFKHIVYESEIDVNFLDYVRTTFNQISNNYKLLTQKSQNGIHEITPWYEEISQSIIRYIGGPKTNKQILFFSGEPDSKGHTYRVMYRMEALNTASIQVEYQSLGNEFNLEKLKNFSAIVMFRVTWNEKVKKIYEFCEANKIIRIFDVDDLVFQPEIMTLKNWDYLRLQNKAKLKYWHEKFINYSKTLIMSDHVIVPTRTLAKAVKGLNKPVSVIENGIGKEMLKRSSEVMSSGELKPSEVDGFIRIGYASGSPTHQKDFKEIYLVICQLLEEYENLMLTVVGHLNLDEFSQLEKFKDRIEKRPLVEHMDLFSEYYRFDINIAPLQSNNVFCDGKSQLKYHESGLVGVPTIASATQPYRDAIHLGVTGYYARDNKDWNEYLSLLINDPELRKKIGQSAQNHVIAKFGPKAQSMLSTSVMTAILNSS